MLKIRSLGVMSSSCFYFKNPCSQNRRLNYPFESAFHVHIHLHKILGKEGFINLFSTLIVLSVYVHLQSFAIFSIFLHTFWELLHIYVCIAIELILCTYLHFCMPFSFFCTALSLSLSLSPKLYIQKHICAGTPFI